MKEGILKDNDNIGQTLMLRRSAYIDIIKGIAIFLVVMGHSIQGHIQSFDDNIVFRIIYSFHMPLFMFVSGYLSSGKIQATRKYLYKKFNRLVIPFIVWYLIDYVFYKLLLTHIPFDFTNFINYTILWIKQPDYGLWFLWVLFLNFLVLIMAFFIDKKQRLVSILLTIIIIKNIPVDLYGIGLLKWHFLFFAIGYIVAKHKDQVNSHRCWMAILAGFFPLLVYEWRRNGMLNVDYFINILGVLYNEEVIKKILLILTPLSGIFMVEIISKEIVSWRIGKPFLFLGKYTLEIYVLHMHFINWPRFMNSFGENFIGVIMVSLCSMIMSMGCIYLMKKNIWIDKIFFGKL